MQLWPDCFSSEDYLANGGVICKSGTGDFSRNRGVDVNEKSDMSKDAAEE